MFTGTIIYIYDIIPLTTTVRISRMVSFSRGVFTLISIGNSPVPSGTTLNLTVMASLAGMSNCLGGADHSPGTTSEHSPSTPSMLTLACWGDRENGKKKGEKMTFLMTIFCNSSIEMRHRRHYRPYTSCYLKAQAIYTKHAKVSLCER